jgi:hypothetical protein
MRGPINVKSPNNITNWQMRFNSAFKGLMLGVVLFLYQMSALFLLVSTQESSPSVSRLSQVEWESYQEMDHQVRFNTEYKSDDNTYIMQ